MMENSWLKEEKGEIQQEERRATIATESAPLNGTKQKTRRDRKEEEKKER